MTWKKRIALMVVACPAVVSAVLAATVLVVVHGGSTTFGPAESREYEDPRQLQIVTVQMHWDLPDYANQRAFEEEIARLMEEGIALVDSGQPALFVFPELIGAPLYLVGDYEAARDKKTFAEAMEAVVIRNPVGVLFYVARFGVSPARALCLAKGKAAGRVYLETFSELARKHGVYISAGSIPLPDFELSEDGSRIDYSVRGPEVYNVSYLFGPDGRILGRQHKTFLTKLEQAEGLDLTPGDLESLQVFDIPGGRIGVAICLDAFHDEVVDRLVDAGADILIQPSANPGPWTPGEQENWLNSAWKQVQRRSELRCAINPMMTGDLFELVFEGQSAVVVQKDEGEPGLAYSAVPGTPGFRVLASRSDDEEVLVTVLE